MNCTIYYQNTISKFGRKIFFNQEINELYRQFCITLLQRIIPPMGQCQNISKKKVGQSFRFKYPSQEEEFQVSALYIQQASQIILILGKQQCHTFKVHKPDNLINFQLQSAINESLFITSSHQILYIFEISACNSQQFSAVANFYYQLCKVNDKITTRIPCLEKVYFYPQSHRYIFVIETQSLGHYSVVLLDQLGLFMSQAHIQWQISQLIYIYNSVLQILHNLHSNYIYGFTNVLINTNGQCWLIGSFKKYSYQNYNLQITQQQKIKIYFQNIFLSKSMYNNNESKYQQILSIINKNQLNNCSQYKNIVKNIHDYIDTYLLKGMTQSGLQNLILGYQHIGNYEIVFKLLQKKEMKILLRNPNSLEQFNCILEILNIKTLKSSLRKHYCQKIFDLALKLTDGQVKKDNYDYYISIMEKLCLHVKDIGIYWRLAELYECKGEIEEAQECLQIALQQNEGQEQTCSLIRFYSRTMRWQKAAWLLQHSEKIIHNQSKYLLCLGSILLSRALLSQNRDIYLKQAELLLRQASKTNQVDKLQLIDIFEVLGDVLLYLKKYEQSYDLYYKSSILGKLCKINYIRIIKFKLGMANTLFLQNKNDKAKEIYKQSLKQISFENQELKNTILYNINLLQKNYQQFSNINNKINKQFSKLPILSINYFFCTQLNKIQN